MQQQQNNTKDDETTTRLFNAKQYRSEQKQRTNEGGGTLCGCLYAVTFVKRLMRKGNQNCTRVHLIIECIALACSVFGYHDDHHYHNTTHHTQPPSLWFAKLYDEGGDVELIQHTTPSRTPYIHPNKRTKNV